MSGLILHYAPFSRAERIKRLLDAFGVTYTLAEVDLERGDRAALREVNPLARVPALQDGDVTLHESGAIVLHLGDRLSLAPPMGTQGDKGPGMVFIPGPVSDPPPWIASNAPPPPSGIPTARGGERSAANAGDPASTVRGETSAAKFRSSGLGRSRGSVSGQRPEIRP